MEATAQTIAEAIRATASDMRAEIIGNDFTGNYWEVQAYCGATLVARACYDADSDPSNPGWIWYGESNPYSDMGRSRPEDILDYADEVPGLVLRSVEHMIPIQECADFYLNPAQDLPCEDDEDDRALYIEDCASECARMRVFPAIYSAEDITESLGDALESKYNER